jgi:glucose-6-phosphate isomerase
MSPRGAWDRYRRELWDDPDLGMQIDLSRMGVGPADASEARGRLEEALLGMSRLEAGAIANPDENRRVGHYWLRAPELAPDPELRAAIEDATRRIGLFADAVHAGRVHPPGGGRFEHLLVIGIGGSALGPQLLAHALGSADDAMMLHFLDNTDPDGFDSVLGGIGGALPRTLTLVVSKSGGTKETRNGMIEAEAAYGRFGLALGPHAVAVTGEGSELDRYARASGFLDVFPMWDWVGGRTSLTSAVGLLPAALQGIDIAALLDGARAMDARTRLADPTANPAARIALAWLAAGNGRGDRDMVVLPYKDRLLLLSRYLQQLVMESLGKEKDLEGRTVHQGIVVYGNKGSTDQHAYVQQLREGPDNFFLTFIEVQKDREGASLLVEEDATSGDFLLGFLLGTRDALTEAGRRSLTITIPEVSARTLGMLIALFERAVGIYAGLVGINAYHQPGVEAGKRAAGRVLEIQRRALAALRAEPDKEWSAEELAARLGFEDETETLFKILEHAAANPDHGVARSDAERPWEARYRAISAGR